MDEYNNKLSEVARLIQDHPLAGEIKSLGIQRLQEWRQALSVDVTVDVTH